LIEGFHAKGSGYAMRVGGWVLTNGPYIHARRLIMESRSI
jgi:hypothetical protein